MKFHKTKPSKQDHFTKAARWCTPFGGTSCAWTEHFIDSSYAGSKYLYHSCWPWKEDCYIVCQLYLPTADITTVKELRWFLFRKKQAESDKLPPTQAALHQAILRAHFQLMVWNKDTEPNPVLPSPSNYGWAMENAEWVLVMTTLPPAPEAVIELVKCQYDEDESDEEECSDKWGPA